MKDSKGQPNLGISRQEGTQDRIVDLDSGIVYKLTPVSHPDNGNSAANYDGSPNTIMDRTPDKRRPPGRSDPSNGPCSNYQNTAGTTPNTPDISPPNSRRPGPGPGPVQGRDVYQAPPSLIDRMGLGPSPNGIAYADRTYESSHSRTDRIPPTPQGYESSSPPRNPHRDYDHHTGEHSRGTFSRSVFESPNYTDDAGSGNPDRLSRKLCAERSRGAGNYVRREEYSEERSTQGASRSDVTPSTRSTQKNTQHSRNKNVEHSEGRRNEKGGTVAAPRMHQGYEKEDSKYCTYTPGDDHAPQTHTQHFMQKQSDEKRLEFERRVAQATRSSQQQQQPRW